jgi:hypothetical protein
MLGGAAFFHRIAAPRFYCTGKKGINLSRFEIEIVLPT